MPFHRRSTLLRVLAWLAVLGGLILAGLSATSRYFWISDLATFFQPVLAAATLVLTCVALAVRRKLAAALLAAMFLINAAPLAVMPVSPAPSGGPPTLRIVSANVLFNHPDPQRLLAAVAEMSPDIILAQEARSGWPQVLGSIPGYPYLVGPDVHPMSSNVVVSRYPMRASVIPGLPSDGHGAGQGLRIEVEIPGRTAPLVVYAVHAPTPRSQDSWEKRRLYFEVLAKLVAAEPQGTDVVMAGDWNTPVWSPLYAWTLRTSGLRPTERSAWPAATRFFARIGTVTLLGTPIDRIAVSSGITVADSFLGPEFGSDHFPVVTDLKLP